MKTFTHLAVFFLAVVALITQGTTMPIPSVPIAKLDHIQRHPVSIPYSQRRGVNNAKTSHPSAKATRTPPRAPVYEQIAHETKQQTGASWADTHPIELVVFFAVTPFAAGVMLYPLCKCLAIKRARRLARKASSCAEKTKSRDGSSSPYLNNPRLEPLPSHPQMVYVPPVAKDGTRPIFGHFRSPSGQVCGVKDRWLLADEGAVELYGTSESKSVFVYPL